MCLYPKLIINRKFIPNKKNNYQAPEIKDSRTLYVPAACGKCIECIKQRGRQWSIRLQEHIRHEKGQFVTLTFSNESIHELSKDTNHIGYERDNEIATRGIRLFLERWRKEFKKSVTHWLTTELGHNGTENIHLHGIIFTENKEAIKKHWKYGFVYVGDYCDESTINYCIKYCTKIDMDHKEYKPKILCSPGIGAKYTTRLDAKLNQYKKGETDERYTSRNGAKAALPIYYRNKIYSEEEREKLWLEKLDKQERWVCGIKISTKAGPEEYYKLLKHYRKMNKKWGYGNDEKNWEQLAYEIKRREINFKKRVEKIRKIEEVNERPIERIREDVKKDILDFEKSMKVAYKSNMKAK